MKETIDELKKELRIDVNIILDYIKDRKGELCHDLFVLYLYNYKISDICKTLKISRFTYKKQYEIGQKVLQSILNEGDI